MPQKACPHFAPEEEDEGADREVCGGVEADTEGGKSGIGAGVLGSWWLFAITIFIYLIVYK